MTEPSAEPSNNARPRVTLLTALGGGAAILAVLAGVYGIDRLRRNPADAACQAAVNTAARIEPLVHGEVAALSLAHNAFRVPDLAFKDAAGRDRAQTRRKLGWNPTGPGLIADLERLQIN